MDHSERLARQWILMEQRAYRQAATQAELLVPHLYGVDRYDAARLLGRAYRYLGEYSAALNWCQQACQGSSDSGDWLDLAIVAALLGRPQLSGEAFDQVRLCQQAAKFAQPPGFYRQMIWYADALVRSGHYDQLWPYLDELARAYRHLGSTDTVSLYSASMPFLSTFLEVCRRAWSKAGWSGKERQWLTSLADGLDPEGAKKVRALVQRLSSN